MAVRKDAFLLLGICHA